MNKQLQEQSPKNENIWMEKKYNPLEEAREKEQKPDKSFEEWNNEKPRENSWRTGNEDNPTRPDDEENLKFHMNQDTSQLSDSDEGIPSDNDEPIIETSTVNAIKVKSRAGKRHYNRGKAIYERDNEAYRYKSPPDFQSKTDNEIKEATQVSFVNPDILPVNQEQHREMLQTSKNPPPRVSGPDPNNIPPKKKIGRPQSPKDRRTT
jgi:hypothetical protein